MQVLEYSKLERTIGFETQRAVWLSGVGIPRGRELQAGYHQSEEPGSSKTEGEHVRELVETGQKLQGLGPH